jgi:type II secretory pathway pseudopilin PulG
MRRSLKSRNYKITGLRDRSRGYMLITLMLGFALIAIGLLAVLPEIGQQIKRDREEEMRHRGTSYMRAIQHFYKKTGRYPSRLEELDNTNNIRYLRKHYKDPINRDPETGKERDFKLLHVTDINLNSGPVAAQLAGLAAQAGLAGQAGLRGQGGLGGLQGQQGALGALQGAIGGLAAQAGGLQQTGLGDAQTSNLNSPSSSATDANPNSPSPSSSNSSSRSPSSSGFNGPTFGGGPILGVASTSKEKSIRVFYQKNHYKDWLFVYMPMADRGGLLTGPVIPGMPSGGSLQGVSGTFPQGQGQGQGQGLGQGQGFGQSQGFGQGTTQGSPQGFGTQNQQNSEQTQQPQ